MMAYIVRRIAYAIPILIGVNVITFLLFFVVNTPDDMARMQLGAKHVSETAIEKWKEERGYDKPVLWNSDAEASGKITNTIFFENSVRLFLFDFGRSDSSRDISYDISQRMWPSLSITVPSLILGLLAYISFGLILAFFRGSYIDISGVILCVAMMSISGLFYIIGGQFLIGKLLNLVPISGYDTGFNAIKFTVLPVLIGLVGGIGAVLVGIEPSFSKRWAKIMCEQQKPKVYQKQSCYINMF